MKILYSAGCCLVRSSARGPFALQAGTRRPSASTAWRWGLPFIYTLSANCYSRAPARQRCILCPLTAVKAFYSKYREQICSLLDSMWLKNRVSHRRYFWRLVRFCTLLFPEAARQIQLNTKLRMQLWHFVCWALEIFSPHLPQSEPTWWNMNRGRKWDNRRIMCVTFQLKKKVPKAQVVHSPSAETWTPYHSSPDPGLWNHTRWTWAAQTAGPCLQQSYVLISCSTSLLLPSAVDTGPWVTGWHPRCVAAVRQAWGFTRLLSATPAGHPLSVMEREALVVYCVFWSCLPVVKVEYWYTDLL